MASLRVAVLLKTNVRGEWVVPQVEELQRRGHEVVAVLPPGDGRLAARLTELGVRIAESPFDFRFRPNLATLRGLWRLRGLLRRLRPDVLNYHLYASALAARIAGIGLPARRVHTVVGPLFLESAAVRTVERLLWRLDDTIICGTQYTSRLYGDIGCPARRRPVVTCGTDTVRMCPPGTRHHVGTGAHPSAVERGGPGRDPVPTHLTADETRAKTRAELGIPHDDFLAVMVAYVYPLRRIVHSGRDLKGHDVMLQAWAAFRARHPRSHLLLVGGGWTAAGDAHRAELIRDFAVTADPGITWLDSATDIRPYYVAADVSVSPSLSEGHGAAVEASAMAVPSIVSDAGGLPEVVGEDGWVVPKGDPAALTAALETAYREFEAGMLAERGDAARRRAVELFDYGTAAARAVDLIEETASRRPRR